MWHASAAALAVLGDVTAASDDLNHSSRGHRRLLQEAPSASLLALPAKAPAQAGSGGPLLSVAPAQNGLPPMLAVDGVTTSLVGFNLYPVSEAACGMNATAFDASLDYLKYQGGSNAVRTWAFQSLYNGSWDGLDHVVAATQQRGMILTVAMANQWGDCETLVDGMRQFKDVAWYRGGYKTTLPGDAVPYRDYVQAFAERYKNYGHVHLQLMNEAVAGNLIEPAKDDSDWACPSDDASATVLQAFTQDMVNLVRLEAPHMLVALGTRGESDDCGMGSNANFAAIAALTDVCELHSYGTGALTVADRLQSCQAAGRPTLMGESAASSNDGVAAYATSPLLNDTNGLLEVQAQLLLARMQNYTNGGLSGTLFWHLAPFTGMDQYALPQGHPVYALMNQTDKAVLVANSAKFNSFSQVALSQSTKPAIDEYSQSSGSVSFTWNCAGSDIGSKATTFTDIEDLDCKVGSFSLGSWSVQCTDTKTGVTQALQIPACD